MVSPERKERIVLAPLSGDEVAPRFDLAGEVWIARLDSQGAPVHERTIVLPRPSAEELCQMVLKERVSLVITGGLEEEYYDYLRWKRVEVADRVVGSLDDVRQALIDNDGAIEPGTILLRQTAEHGDDPCA